MPPKMRDAHGAIRPEWIAWNTAIGERIKQKRIAAQKKTWAQKKFRSSKAPIPVIKIGGKLIPQRRFMRRGGL